MPLWPYWCARCSATIAPAGAAVQAANGAWESTERKKNRIAIQRKRLRYGEELQGSGRSFRRTAETELSGLCKHSPVFGGEAASQTGAQRKRVRFGEEEQGSGRSFRRQAETELSGLCDDDEGAYRFRRGHGSGNSGRWRLATLKRALLYKLKNNENYAYAA